MFRAMLPRPVRPSRAIADFVAFVRMRRQSEIWAGLLAVCITLLWFWMIFDKLNPTPEYVPPPVNYVKQWPKTRTEAEVAAQQAKDLPAEIAARKRREEEAAAERAKYDKLAKQFGID